MNLDVIEKHVNDNQTIKVVLELLSSYEEVFEKNVNDNQTIEDCKKTIEMLKYLSDVKDKIINKLLDITIKYDDDHKPAHKRTKDVTCIDCRTLFMASVHGRASERCTICRKSYYREFARNKYQSIKSKEKKRLQELDNQTQ